MMKNVLKISKTDELIYSAGVTLDSWSSPAILNGLVDVMFGLGGQKQWVVINVKEGVQGSDVRNRWELNGGNRVICKALGGGREDGEGRVAHEKMRGGLPVEDAERD